MPINHHRSPSAGGIPVEEFKKWLDVNGDGRISKDELREAIHRRGGWFASLKAGHAVRHADTDKSGFVEDAEIENLITFAQKYLGMKISARQLNDQN